MLKVKMTIIFRIKFLIVIVYLASLLVLQSVLFAQTPPVIGLSSALNRLCATPVMTGSFIDLAKANTLNLYPEMVKEGLETPEWLEKGLVPVIGDSMQFWAFNIKDEVFYRLWAELRGIGSSVMIWVEKSELQDGTVKDVFASDLINAFEVSTPSGSLDNTKGIIAIEREVFGVEPNRDGDGITDILLLDVKDFFEDNSLSFISGFFLPNDQFSNASPGVNNSNERDLLYLDTKPGISQGTLLNTAAHEYQHLIHYNYDTNEINLINEGASQLAQIVTGYEWDDPTIFLDNPDRGLFFWGELSDPDILADYAKAQMWMIYLWDHFGPAFIKALVQSPLSGRSSLLRVLSDLGGGQIFAEVVQKWLIANYLNDTSVDPFYGYFTEQAKTVKAALKTSVINYPASINDDLNGLAAEYVKLKNGSNLSALFTGTDLSVRAINIASTSVEISEVPVGVTYTDDGFGNTHKEIVFVIMNDSESKTSYTYFVDAFSPFFVREVQYDDGIPDVITGTQDGVWWGTNTPGFGWAVKFSPLNEESFLLGAKAHIFYNTSVMGSPDFLFRVLDDTGPNGSPGKELIPVQTVSLPSTNQFTWWEIDLSNFQDSLSQYRGDYFLSLEHPPDDTNAVFVAVDNSQPTVNHSWALIGRASQTRQPGWYPMSGFSLGDDEVSLAPFDLMFRALVSFIDNETPVFSIGFLQHPVFTENFDFYVVGKSELNPGRLEGTVTIGDEVQTLTFVPSGATGKVFVDNSVTFSSDGVASLRIKGSNKFGLIELDTTVTFSIQGVAPGASAKISNPSGTKILSIPANSVKKRTIFTAIDGRGFTFDVDDLPPDLEGSKRIGKAVTFGPIAVFDGGLQLRFRYPKEKLTSQEQDNLIIARLQNNRWSPLSSSVNRENNTVAAATEKLGTFQIFRLDKPLTTTPLRYELLENYPNPFNGQTVIRFSIKFDEVVNLKIYNLLGEEIRTLKSEFLTAGQYSVTWDGKNDSGFDVASGVYLYRVTSGPFNLVKKMILIKQ